MKIPEEALHGGCDERRAHENDRRGEEIEREGPPLDPLRVEVVEGRRREHEEERRAEARRDFGGIDDGERFRENEHALPVRMDDVVRDAGLRGAQRERDGHGGGGRGRRQREGSAPCPPFPAREHETEHAEQDGERLQGERDMERRSRRGDERGCREIGPASRAAPADDEADVRPEEHERHVAAEADLREPCRALPRPEDEKESDREERDEPRPREGRREAVEHAQREERRARRDHPPHAIRGSVRVARPAGEHRVPEPLARIEGGAVPFPVVGIPRKERAAFDASADEAHVIESVRARSELAPVVENEKARGEGAGEKKAGHETRPR